MLEYSPPGRPFLDAVLDRPEDDAPRLIFSDWLEEQGDARGAFIRTQCELERLSPAEDRHSLLRWREAQMLKKHRQEWLGPLAELDEIAPRGWKFRRGFVEEGAMSLEALCDSAETIFRHTPLRRVQLHGLRGAKPPFGDDWFDDEDGEWFRLWTPLTNLVQIGGLHAIRDLWLDCASLDDAGLRAFLASPRLARLRALRLSRLRLGRAAAHDIAAAPHLESLETLDVQCLGGRSESFGHVEIAALAQSSRLPRLRSLVLTNVWMQPATLHLILEARGGKGLRELTIRRSPLHQAHLHAIATSPGALRLEKLELSECGLGDRDAAPLAASPFLANLRSLSLGGNSLGRAAAESLAQAPFLRRLHELDLHGNRLDDHGFTVLLAGLAGAELTRLHVGENRLSGRSMKALCESPIANELVELRMRHCRLDSRAVRIFAASGRFGRLIALDLSIDAGRTFATAGATQALVESPQAARLNELRISGFHITASVARRMAHGPYLPRLVELECQSGFSPRLVAAKAERILRERWGDQVAFWDDIPL